jgi:hypothetical protein
MKICATCKWAQAEKGWCKNPLQDQALSFVTEQTCSAWESSCPPTIRRLLELKDDELKILAALVLKKIDEARYDCWPGDEEVQNLVELYAKLAPHDARNVTLETMENSRRCKDRRG